MKRGLLPDENRSRQQLKSLFIILFTSTSTSEPEKKFASQPQKKSIYNPKVKAKSNPKTIKSKLPIYVDDLKKMEMVKSRPSYSRLCEKVCIHAKQKIIKLFEAKIDKKPKKEYRILRL